NHSLRQVKEIHLQGFVQHIHYIKSIIVNYSDKVLPKIEESGVS
ncbi:14624_t:CDS:1, partial [Cetraspora pellucida]